MFNKCKGIALAHKFITTMFEKRANKVSTQLTNTPTEKGETIEEILRRLTANKEPIPENVPPIYTPKADGVIPDYDIRADRFDVAMTARDKFAASEIAKSAQKGETAEEQTTKETTTQTTEKTE